VQHNLRSVILVNDQLDTLFLNVFISCLYIFRASAHHQEGQNVLIHHLVKHTSIIIDFTDWNDFKDFN
jgi:hypothetical protein